MLVVHGTKRFRDRVQGPATGSDDWSTGLLGSWYATLRWRSPVALFVIVNAPPGLLRETSRENCR
jgi:hypothetical protein